MLSFQQQSVEIVRCDNGFVVEWKDERKRPTAADTDTWYRDTRGISIFKTKRDLDGFLAKFFG